MEGNSENGFSARRRHGSERVAIKTALLIALFAFLVASHSFGTIQAQSTQTSYTVNLTHLTVQLSYPTEVMPGDSVTVNVQAFARRSLSAISLNVQIFYSDGVSLHQVASAAVTNSYYMSSGGSFSKQIQFAIPQSAPRTSLVAVLTESVQTTSYGYYYPAYYYNSSYPNCYYYPDYYSYYYGYCTYYGYAYPSYSYSTSTDSGVAPLSYINATTPEFVSLQTEYQALQQQLAQSQAENQKLKQNLQDTQNTITQRDATIADLNQQLSSTQAKDQTVQAVALALAIIAVVLGVFAFLVRGSKRRPAEARGNTPREDTRREDTMTISGTDEHST